MRHFFWLVAVFLIGSTYTACAPNSSMTPLVAGTISHVRPLDIQPCSDGDSPNAFLNNVYTISDQYASSNITYNPPVGVLQIISNASMNQITSDLRSAYCLAPTTFRKQLKDLSGVFITCKDPNNCTPSNTDKFSTSWGYRENASNQSALQHTFIALSVNSWPSLNSSPEPYANFEYEIIDRLLAGTP